MRFIHIVDSRVPEDPLSVKDEGLFKKLENGDDLETGTMLNPRTGSMMPYEEIWRDLPVQGKSLVLLKSMGDIDKAFIGRIGVWFQGIGTENGVVNAARRKYEGGEWRTVFSIGTDQSLPLIFEQHGWKKGDEIEIAGRWWKVLDCEGSYPP